MATDKPRFSITVSDDIYQMINEYQHEHRLPTQTKAVVAFIEKGLEVIQKEKRGPLGVIEVEPLQKKEKATDNFSRAEKAHIKKYRSLDPYGKEAVDGILDVEWRRCAERVPQEQELDTVYFIVPGYALPMSAGLGEPADLEPPEDFHLKNAPPRGTSYIARVHGHSMEPSYYDGQLVFVHATEDVPVGKIGVFLMDGQQWIKERGVGVLISHNSGYDPIPMRDDIRCQGLVLGVCDESYFK